MTDKSDVVAVTMNKVVDGKEVEMGGTVDFHVDYAERTLTYEMQARDGAKGLFRLAWSGDEMTGTLTMPPGGDVIRNITLAKD